MSGSTTIGCCSYIASFVYYLSFARHCFDFSICFPGSHFDNYFHVNESSDWEFESNCDKKDFNSLNDSDSSNAEVEIEDEIKDKIEINESTNEKLSIFEPDTLTETEILSQEQNRIISIEPNIEWLVEFIPFWGGSLIDINGNKTEISFINTCTIDYFLFSIWLST